MISRRALLVSAAPAALALGGCSSAKLAGIADSAYVQLVTVARVIEKAVATIVSDVKAAIAMVTPYIVPACRIVVSMDTMAQTLISNGSLKPATGSTLSTVLENLPVGGKRVLMMLPQRDENVVLSTRNIPSAKVQHVSSINVIELLKHDYVIMPRNTARESVKTGLRFVA